MRWLSDKPLCIFCATSLIYLATAGGHFYTSDGGTMYEVTRSLLTRGSFEVPRESVPGCLGPDGKAYAPWGLGMSLAFIPFDLAGRLLARLMPPLQDKADFLALSSASLVNVFVTAWMAALVFSFCSILNLQVRTAVLTALAFAFGTMAWPYSKQPWNVQLASALQLWALFLTVQAMRTNVCKGGGTHLSPTDLGWNGSGSRYYNPDPHGDRGSLCVGIRGLAASRTIPAKAGLRVIGTMSACAPGVRCCGLVQLGKVWRSDE